MQPATIGTAGPAGHGKTALVHALAGLDASTADAAGIRVDLGFAFHEIGGQRVGVVDQPGTERLVRTLLGDLHGMDLVLVVVAADEGVLPQTEECVDILHLLGAREAIFVITKCDLVDAHRREEVRAAVVGLAKDTRLEQAPTFAVSSTTGEGIADLRADLLRRVRGRTERGATGLFRMFVDRSFTVPGRGPTVTGTVLAGALRTGDPVTILPGHLAAEAESVQVHGESVARAAAGQRVAIRLRNLPRKHVRRGLVLADPRVEFATDRFDCRVEVRPGARAALRSFDRVEIDVGTVETAGSVVVLEKGDAIAPGASGFCQIALERETVLSDGDRFVLRPSGGARTSGGGVVLHAFAVRHTTGEPNLTERLARLGEPALPPRLLAFVELLPEVAIPIGYAAQGLGVLPDDVRRAAAGTPELLPLPDTSSAQALATRTAWERLAGNVDEALSRYHRAHPDDAGLDPEVLRARLRVPVPPRLLDVVVARLVADGVVVREDALLRLPRHRPGQAPTKPAVRPRAVATAGPGTVRQAIVDGGMAPPDHRQLATATGLSADRLATMLGALEREGSLVAVSPDLHMDRAAYDRARHLLVEHLANRREITVAEYRTLLETSRKYALALLEHFDREGLTVRDGDTRRLAS